MFNEQDLTLLHAFLQREANDFRNVIIQNRRKEWIDFRVQKIEEALINIKVDYVRIRSLSNMGCLVRELVLSPPDNHWDWKGGDLQVTLCACGKDAHWGHVQVVPRKPIEIFPMVSE